MNKYWFRQRRYGFGAVPSTWEGWVFIVVFITLLAVGGQVLPGPMHTREDPWPFLAIILGGTALFLFVCWRKTEGGWRWRWGGD